MRRLLAILGLAGVFVLVLWTVVWAQSAVLLPNGKQQFLDSDGNPLATGTVGMYVPSTLTPKTTWQDSGESTPNINPVQLDSAGEALIYGNGSYRQIVKDALGNTIWDALTSGFAGPFPAWGGTSSGGGNTPTILASSWTPVAGAQIEWRVGATNTGAVTLTIGSTAYSLYLPTATGPSALSGGELALGNIALAAFDSVTGGLILTWQSNQLNPFYQTIELGNASDTTLARASAGVMSVEGVSLNPGIPITSKSAAYTVVLADANTSILHPAADNNARTFTINSNANVAYPVGTTLTFINMINTVTIAITSDTLTLIGAGTTGSRTLAASGMATAIKISSTAWVISGTNLT